MGLLTANQCREPQYLSSLRIVALTVLCRILNFTGHWPYCAIAIYWLSASIEAVPEQYRSLLSHPSFQCHPNTLTEILLGHVLRCISGSLSLSRFCLNSPWLSPSPVPLILIPDILKQLSFFSYIRIVINLCLYPN